MHDFLLASMIVTINIIQAFGPNSITRKEVREMDQHMVEALEKSHSIFTQSQSVTADARISTDARKASSLLRAMLNKVNRALGHLSPPDGPSKTEVPIPVTWYTRYPNNTTAPPEINMQFNPTQAAPAADPLGAIINIHIPGDVDWIWPNFSSADLAFDDFDSQMLDTNPL
ncbi:hypothetical protein LAWI1_G004710 [Lachnellula willkommii]|uniref:Uncharacterized protein n=1 Tax=Lachnellula willkommii TaxID=215461 RepID=A0A559MCB1_9HELO|nr:hypothetical protein LAWI1_G004710 [Lachnellula willkommii]